MKQTYFALFFHLIKGHGPIALNHQCSIKDRINSELGYPCCDWLHNHYVCGEYKTQLLNVM